MTEEKSLKWNFYIFLGSKDPKSKRFFMKTNRQIERLSETVFIVLVKITRQFVITPKFIVSFATYLITDSGKDSFQLPLPLW